MPHTSDYVIKVDRREGWSASPGRVLEQYGRGRLADRQSIRALPDGGASGPAAPLTQEAFEMRTQWIPALGLAATIAISGYMASQLSADSATGPSTSSPVTAPATP